MLSIKKRVAAQGSSMCECCSEISQESAMNMYQRVFLVELHHKTVFVRLFGKLAMGRQKMC